MKDDGLLTVSEVATALHISRQAVYSRLEKDFKCYLTIKNGKKLLNKAVLHTSDNSEVSSNLSTEVSTYLTKTLQLLQAQNEQLQHELEVKNKQIEDLSLALVAAQQTAQTAQALHAGTIHQQLTAGGVDPAEPEQPQDDKKTWHFWKR